MHQNLGPSRRQIAAPSPRMSSTLFSRSATSSPLPSEPPYSPHRSASDILKPAEPHPNIVSSIYGVSKKPRTVKQWEDIAKENTQQLIQHGSPSPLVWVFVKGKEIPANAIVGGEDRRRPLYIARTFYEGGICLGKAGRHLERGASIPFNGKEIQVDTYEVLVPALQPLRYAISNTIQMPTIPRFVPETPAVEGLSRLNLTKTVVVVDDSDSMAGSLWMDAREALAGVADLNCRASADGVDVYFLNDARFMTNVKDGNQVRQIFNNLDPTGTTPLGEKLQQIIDKYIPLLENPQSKHKPITLIVITDGVPTDDPTEVIVRAARRLERSGVPLSKFGIQFVQIGDDEEATDALRELDDDLAARYNIRDMVDTIVYNPDDPKFTTNTILKIVFGAIDSSFDISSALSPMPMPVPCNPCDPCGTDRNNPSLFIRT
ncbi:hypothetical protein BD779DRAFT_1571940 [Infundibulicybe gibba]|nr:hypothetical protein BD779DRAFT_1571940 [Infundibulicybe gibba]